MSSRDEILGLITDRPSEIPPVAHLRPDIASSELWARFEVELKALGGEIRTPDDLLGLSEWRTLIDPDVPIGFRHGLLETDDVWQAEIGLTMAEYAVAETGTLLLNSGEGRRRLGSLTPPHHVVLVPLNRIFASLDELFSCGFGRTSVLITGPSRTADIEGVLVRGIHGPKRLWVILID